MARISGVDVPDNKRVEVALRYIKGIGPSLSKKILDDTQISYDIRAKDLTDTQVASINSKIVDLEIPVEGELRRIVTTNIRRLIEIRAYRGIRHQKGLPVRGQRTRANARTRKGKRKTVANKKKVTK